MSLFPALFYHDFFEPLSIDNILLKYEPNHSNNNSLVQSNNDNNNNNNNNLKSILKVDLIETENEFQVHADLPGVEEKDLDVSIENNHLVIKGHREKNVEVKNATQHRIERSYGSVQRSIRLPPNADQSSCNANLENGILTITLTKKPLQQPKVNKIQITSGNMKGENNNTNTTTTNTNTTTSDENGNNNTNNNN